MYKIFCLNGLIYNIIIIVLFSAISNTYGDSHPYRHKLDTAVVVSSKRLPYELNINVINSKEFVGLQKDLSSVLEQIAGISIKKTGGFGEYSEASIRGGLSRHVQVYLDGIPLNSASGGAVDLSKIPITSLQKITVYKGNVPIELMGASSGAVINLTSKVGTDVKNAELELGSYNHQKAGVILRKRINDLTYQFTMDYAHSDNDYFFWDDRGTTLGANATDDDTLRRKDNNKYDLISSQLSMDYNLSDFRKLSFFIEANKTDKEFFHKSQADLEQLTTLTKQNLRGYIKYEQDFSTDSYIDISTKGTYTNTLFSDPLGLYWLGGKRKEESYQPHISGDILIFHKLNDNFSIKGKLSGKYESFSTNNLLASDTLKSPITKRYTASGAFSLSYKNYDKLHISLRYNQLYTRDSSGFALIYGADDSHSKIMISNFQNANIDLSLTPNKHITINTSARYEFLPISFSDRYGWGNGYIGNKDLLPEKRSEATLGLLVKNHFLTNNLIFLGGYIRDEIGTSYQSMQIAKSVNIGNTEMYGFELESSFNIKKIFFIDNNLHYIKKRIVSSQNSWQEGKIPQGYSPFKENLRLTVTYNIFSIGHFILYKSPFYEDTQELEKITQLPELTVFLRFSPIEIITLTYRLENYLNVQNLNSHAQAPLPGRMHFVSLKLNF